MPSLASNHVLGVMLPRRITAWLCLSALLACQGRDSSHDSVGDSRAGSTASPALGADAPTTASTGTWVAAGTEPFWALHIDSTGLRFKTPDDTSGIHWLRSTRGSRPIRYAGSGNPGVRPLKSASGLRDVATACPTKCGRIPLWCESTPRAIADVRSLARENPGHSQRRRRHCNSPWFIMTGPDLRRPRRMSSHGYYLDFSASPTLRLSAVHPLAPAWTKDLRSGIAFA
jgi:hypothetical protein